MKTRIVGIMILMIVGAYGASDGVDYVAGKRRVKEQLAREWLQCSEMASKNAELSLPVNEELRKLIESVPENAGKAIGESMTPDQADKFGRLGQKQQFFMGKSLFISKRERDIEIIQDVYELIMADFEQVKVSTKRKQSEDQEKLVRLLVDLVGNIILEKGKEVEKVELVRDSVNLAIGELIKCVGDMMDSRGEKLRTYQALWEKQKNTKFKVADMSPVEKEEYDKIRDPVKVALDAHTRLIGLRILYTLMTYENKWGMEEFSASAGNLEAAGKRMNEFAEKTTEEIQMMVGVIRLINEKFPCRLVRDMSSLKKSK